MAKRVLISFHGSRGDQQPYVVAAQALIGAGYEVMLSGSGDCKGLAKDMEVPFTRTRFSQMRHAANPNVVKQLEEGKMPKEVFMRDAEQRHNEMSSEHEVLATFKPDLVLASPLVILDFFRLCKHMDIPLLSFSLQRGRASHSVPPDQLEFLPRGRMTWTIWGLVLNYALKNVKEEEKTAAQLFGKSQGDMKIGLDDIYDFWSERAAFPSLIAESVALHGPLPSDFNQNNIIVSALMMPADSQVGKEFGEEKKEELHRFLQAGPAPVYIGFGSMLSKTPQFMALLCVRALRKANVRGIVCAGWSDMSLEQLQGASDAEELKAFCEENVLFMKYAPHGVLFPKCQAVVHHGGAGTLNASASSGKPTIIVPVGFDQWRHGNIVNNRGIGVGLKTRLAKMTPDKLAAAITKCVTSTDIQQKAAEVGEAMRKEDGAAELVKFVKDYMQDSIDTGRHMQRWHAILKQRAEEKTKGGWGSCLACCSSSSKPSGDAVDAGY